MTRHRAIRVIVQARISSSRLPGKVVLPLGGMPIAALAALRAANTGLSVVVATSTAPSDDIVVAELSRHRIATFRGDLRDVLGRFVDATRDLADGDVCVRLTADNVFPDGAFIDSLIAEFDRRDATYLSSSPHLPYGLSAEIVPVGELRNAARVAVAASEREHVTPFIRATSPRACVSDYAPFGHLGTCRATIDTLGDYERIAGILKGCEDPVAISHGDLVARLVASEAGSSLPASAQFVLGTAQLGLAYGRTNRVGNVSSDAAEGLLERAIDGGIGVVDTARAYGRSEARVGAVLARHPHRAVTPVTKLDPLDHIDGTWPAAAIRASVEASVLRSLQALKRDHLPVLLLHRATHLRALDGAIWRTLQDLRDEGLIGRLGVSVQSPSELAAATTVRDVAHVQIPYNILDHRWDQLLTELETRDDLTIHVRSVYLQGLLAAETAADWPRIEGVDTTTIHAALLDLAQSMGRSVRDLCLAFVRGTRGVGGVVVGVETVAQLEENFALFRTPPLSPEEVEAIRRAMPVLPNAFLDPSRWPQAS